MKPVNCAVLATLFFLTSLGLAYFGLQQHKPASVLDRTALAKVREHRPTVATAGLDGPRELGETDDGDIEFFREVLEISRYDRNLLLAVLRRLAHGDELKVTPQEL